MCDDAENLAGAAGHGVFVNVRRLDGISKPQSPPRLSLRWRREDAALVNHEAALLLPVCYSEVLDPVWMRYSFRLTTSFFQ
jgi:hypothetical protein